MEGSALCFDVNKFGLIVSSVPAAHNTYLLPTYISSVAIKGDANSDIVTFAKAPPGDLHPRRLDVRVNHEHYFFTDLPFQDFKGQCWIVSEMPVFTVLLMQNFSFIHFKNKNCRHIISCVFPFIFSFFIYIYIYIYIFFFGGGASFPFRHISVLSPLLSLSDLPIPPPFFFSLSLSSLSLHQPNYHSSFFLSFPLLPPSLSVLAWHRCSVSSHFKASIEGSKCCGMTCRNYCDQQRKLRPSGETRRSRAQQLHRAGEKRGGCASGGTAWAVACSCSPPSV